MKESFPRLQKGGIIQRFESSAKPEMKQCFFICAYLHFPKSIIVIMFTVGSMTQKQKVRNIALEKNAGSSGIMSVEKGLFYFYFLFL
jgi:hypothetical protein